MKFSNPEARRLVKSAAAHRRLARHAKRRLRDAVRSGAKMASVWSNQVDANLRCAAMDFAMAREVEAK
jgi:hypothetical protein